VDGLNHLSVLVVDHDPWTRLHLTTALSDVGLNVAQASNGMTALRRAQAETPHVLIVGSGLPELSAPELVRSLRSDSRTRQVAIVGVHNEVGADATLQLPCTSFDVLSTVVEALEESRRQAGAATPIQSVSASARGAWSAGASTSAPSSSSTRNAGRAAKWRLSSGIERL
jgi:DNA-binding response OmpR family regulator